MASVLICTLFLSSMIHIVVGIPTLDFYLPSIEDANVVRFECINDHGEPDPTARFEFYNSTGALITRQDANQSYLTYTITEDAIIRCIVGQERSQDFMFAGKVSILY